MAPTPAQKHFMRVTAQRESEAAAEPQRSLEQMNQYEIMMMMLVDHKRKLKEIQSIERKAEAKKEFIPEYDSYIDGVLASDVGIQDDILMTLMVWMIDVGDLVSAMLIGEYALRHNLQTPEQYNRDTATLLAEEVAEFAMKHPDIISKEKLVLTESLTRDNDMPDEVRAKLYKALGIAVQTSSPASALSYFHRALELNKKAGVKKMIEQTERTIKNQT